MNHSEEPAEGCVRETQEELGILIELDNRKPVITQRSFFRDGVSFVSFTYCGRWNGSIDELKLKEGEIEAAAWFSLHDAIENAASELTDWHWNRFRIEQGLSRLAMHHQGRLHPNLHPEPWLDDHHRHP